MPKWLLLINRYNFFLNVENLLKLEELLQFFLVMNLAVGGTEYFPDEASNPGGKPWSNDSPHAATDFWNAKNQWLPTWNLEENNGENDHGC